MIFESFGVFVISDTGEKNVFILFYSRVRDRLMSSLCPHQNLALLVLIQIWWMLEVVKKSFSFLLRSFLSGIQPSTLIRKSGSMKTFCIVPFPTTIIQPQTLVTWTTRFCVQPTELEQIFSTHRPVWPVGITGDLKVDHRGENILCSWIQRWNICQVLHDRTVWYPSFCLMEPIWIQFSSWSRTIWALHQLSAGQKMSV